MSKMMSILKSDIKNWYYLKIKKMTEREMKLEYLKKNRYENWRRVLFFFR